MTHRVRALPLFLVVTMILTVALIMFTPAMAVKGSYPGSNGKIAFDAIGLEQGQVHTDIFVMSNDATDVRQLTHNEVSDYDPCWSPDGTKIAFSSGGRIWIMDADGSNLQGPLTAPGEDQYDGDPAWSPDGSKIAFIRNGEFNHHYLWLMSADGSNPSRLLLSEDYVYDPHWSLDGTVIAVGVDPDLALVNTDGGGSMIARTDFSGLQMTAETLSWSPDNSKIAFSLSDHNTGHSEIYWVKGDLTGARNPLTINTPGSWGPDWSPDGTKIVFSREGASVWIMNADGSGARGLSPSMPEESQNPDYQRQAGAAVGGVLEPAKMFALVAPWIAVIGLVGCISTVVVVREKRRKWIITSLFSRLSRILGAILARLHADFHVPKTTSMWSPKTNRYVTSRAKRPTRNRRAVKSILQRLLSP